MFTKNLRINFYDTDAAGILFFGNLFKLAHQVYELFLEEISPERNFFDDELLLPIIHSEADYKAPLKAGEKIEVQLFVSKLKSSSFELTYLFLSNNTLKASAKTVHVSVDRQKFQKVNLPAQLKKAFNNYTQK